MAGRGPQTFQKRQKEQQRKEKQEAKRAKRLERKHQNEGDSTGDFPDTLPASESPAHEAR